VHVWGDRQQKLNVYLKVIQN